MSELSDEKIAELCDIAIEMSKTKNENPMIYLTKIVTMELTTVEEKVDLYRRFKSYIETKTNENKST